MNAELFATYSVLELAGVVVNLVVLLRVWLRATTVERSRSGAHLLVVLMCVVNICWCLPAFLGSIIAFQNDYILPLGAGCAALGFFAVFGWLATIAVLGIMSYYANRLVEGFPMKRHAVIGSSLLFLAIAILLAGLPAADVGSYQPSPDVSFCFMDWSTAITSVSLIVFVFSSLFMASTSYIRMFMHIKLSDLGGYSSVSDAELSTPVAVAEHDTASIVADGHVEMTTEADLKDIQQPGYKHVAVTLGQVCIMNLMMLWLWTGFILVIVIALQHLRQAGEEVPRALYGATAILTYLQAIFNPVLYSTLWLKWFGVLYDY